MVGVEQWAEIRRHAPRRAAARSGRSAGGRGCIARRSGGRWRPRRRRGTARAPAGSKLDPFRDWICEQLRADPTIQSLRLREMAAELGYEGGKTIFDDYVREVRPRFLVKRTFQRTVYRPGELVQCDLWEPREPVPVGHGQTRRGWVVTAELCWSRVIAGRADLLQGGAGHPLGSGPLPGADRRAAGEAGLGPRGRDPAGGGRPTDAFAGVLRAARRRLGDPRRRRRAGQGRAGALAPVHAHELRAGPAVREPARLPAAARRLVRQGQPAGAPHDPRRPGRAARRGARADAAAARAAARQRPAAGGARAAAAVSARRSQRLLDRPGVRRPPRRGARLPDARSSRSCWTPASSPCRHRRVLRRRPDDHRPGASDRARAPARAAPPAPRRRGRDPAAGPLRRS